MVKVEMSLVSMFRKSAAVSKFVLLLGLFAED
jgi:hypothetical protein